MGGHIAGRRKSQEAAYPAYLAVAAGMRCAALSGMPWVMLGQLERIIYNCRVLFGDDCFEAAARQRRAFFQDDEE